MEITKSIRIINIGKSFAGNHVLQDISLSLTPSSVHALLGANGSGKSTLVKILTGVYQRDKGDIILGDNSLPIVISPSMIKQSGVRVVHQETPLIRSLSIADNVALFSGYWTNPLKPINRKKLSNYIHELFSALNLNINPNQLAGNLSSAERAMVSLAIAFRGNDSRIKLLILDEADASIPEDDAEEYLQLVRKVADSGVPVLMVTHRLRAVRQFCNDVTVLNNGRVGISGLVKDYSDDDFVENMLSQESRSHNQENNNKNNHSTFFSVNKKESNVIKGQTILSVKNLLTDSIKDISFDLKAGEIIGVAGLITSGIADLPAVFSGTKQRIKGDILLGDRILPKSFSPKSAIEYGISVLPVDRLNEGGVGNMTLHENMLLPQLPRFWNRKKFRNDVVNDAIELLDIRPANMNAQFGAMSGGNQQKVLLAKWILLNPKVLVLNDPTNGVDPAARLKIISVIQKAAANGISVLFLSTEPEQLASICSRILVLKNGLIATELTNNKEPISRETIARWCYS